MTDFNLKSDLSKTAIESPQAFAQGAKPVTTQHEANIVSFNEAKQRLARQRAELPLEQVLTPGQAVTSGQVVTSGQAVNAVQVVNSGGQAVTPGQAVTLAGQAVTPEQVLTPGQAATTGVSSEKQGFLSGLWDFVINKNENVGLSDFAKKLTDYVVNKLYIHATALASAVNFACGVGQLTLAKNDDDAISRKLENVGTFFAKARFLPYVLNGVVNSIRKKNALQLSGFLGELIAITKATLKNLYTWRGLFTTLDQFSVFTEQFTDGKYADSVFPDWWTGFKEMMSATASISGEIAGAFTKWISNPKETFQNLAAILSNPAKALRQFEPKGHLACFSTLGSLFSSIMYVLTGNEKIWPYLRVFFSQFIDLEFFAVKGNSKFVKAQKAAGASFLSESTADAIGWATQGLKQKFFKHISNGLGGIALTTYLMSYNYKLDGAVDTPAQNHSNPGETSAENSTANILKLHAGQEVPQQQNLDLKEIRTAA